MPRIPGRKSTRKTYDVSQVLVASFIMSHEEWLWRRPCVITGCDHRMGPKTDEPGWVNWKSCLEGQVPAFVVLDDGEYDTQVGIACPCHVQEILDEIRDAHALSETPDQPPKVWSGVSACGSS